MNLTIFTPTYNREKELQVLFESLQKQTNKNFCWLIVDDGSEDNTQFIVEKMKHEATFDIIYEYQKNSGKPFAFNKGVELTKTKYFMCMDSDDFFVEQAIEIFYESLEKYEKKMETLVGIVFQALDSNHKLLTRKNFPATPWESDFFSLTFEENMGGDTAIFYKTVVLKQNLFPKFGDEKFVPEALMLHRLAKIGNFYFINTPLIIKDYQIDGFSNNMHNLYLNNPRGYYQYCLEVLNFHNPGFMQTARHVAAIGVFGKKIKKKNSDILMNLEKKRHKLIYLMLLPAIHVYKL